MRLALVLVHLIAAATWIGGHLLLATGLVPSRRRARSPEWRNGFEERVLTARFVVFAVQALTGIALAFLRYSDIRDALPADSPLVIAGSVRPIVWLFALASIFSLRAFPLGMIDFGDLPPPANRLFDAGFGIMLLVLGADCLGVTD